VSANQDVRSVWHLPSQFDLAKYSEIAKLDAKVWLEQLTVRSKLDYLTGMRIGSGFGGGDGLDFVDSVLHDPVADLHGLFPYKERAISFGRPIHV